MVVAVHVTRVLIIRPHDYLRPVPGHGYASAEKFNHLLIRCHNLRTRIPRRSIVVEDVGGTCVAGTIRVVKLRPHDNLRPVPGHGYAVAELVIIRLIRCLNLRTRIPRATTVGEDVGGTGAQGTIRVLKRRPNDKLRAISGHGDAIAEVVNHRLIRCLNLRTRIPRPTTVGKDVGGTGVATTRVLTTRPNDNLRPIRVHGDAPAEDVSRLLIR